ncbi:phosphatidate cytidylyltransferase [Marimonas arenosa]|uniref:Phosphatidate cytidylyltransferase n=1 Tax=Marimonas arenosa TaxID=1795305 RepID=A0AAE3W9S4_9RHOB|nr:phosphatidate cytidylyltransferase [Marimonas arenosa]MDQ2088508.1 phosphatidate cytidylyltransferase [Marimonas arenosa]
MSDGKWGDLGPRAASAVVMLVVGAAAIWAGGLVFAALAVAIVALMIWELVRMIRPGHDSAAVQEAALAAAAFALALWFPGFSLLILGGLVIVLMGRTGRHMALVGLYTAGIFLAGLGLVWLRLDHGLLAALWLILVVVATDVAGYFAGRILGGPKFWPRVSPKKTWAGTVAGWIAAALVTLYFAYGLYETPPLALPLTVLAGVGLSFASQMGDVAESALKRKMGVKDSSTLIPGHGGVMDRFDAMMGASLLVSVITGLSAINF